MELNFKSNIKQWLDNLEELQPIPTGFCPNLKTDSPAKALIFDIYGTLIISSSGDIDQASMSVESMKQALYAGGFNESVLYVGMRTLTSSTYYNIAFKSIVLASGSDNFDSIKTALAI